MSAGSIAGATRRAVRHEPPPLSPEQRRAAATMAVAVGLLVLVYWQVLFHMVLHWRHVADYNHGFLVAPLALFFAWGFVGVDRWLAHREWTAGRVLLFAWWGALLGFLYLSFAG